MSAFEDFVQLELPKRPYLETDAPQETIMVRRGPGPRQLAGVELAEGQVLGKVGGALVGVSLGAGATFKKYSQEFLVASTIWTVSHSQSSTNFIAQVFDELGKVVIPDEIETTDADTVTIRFSTAAVGSVRIIFLD